MPSRDPYWVSIHASLDLLDRRDRPFKFQDGELEWTLGSTTMPSDVSFMDFYPGDHLFCTGGTTRIPYVFHEYLESKGHVLTARELYQFENMKRTLEARRGSIRPCVVLERHGPHSYSVCFSASFNSFDISEDEPGLGSMLIRYGNDQEGGLRSHPELNGPWVLALPVVREHSILRPKVRYGPGYGVAMRQRLSYGELERMRSLVRAKEAKFATNHETIRRTEVAKLLDPSHRASHIVRPSHRVKIPQSKPPDKELSLQMIVKRYRKTVGVKPRGSVWVLPSAACNNTAWVVKHAEQEIANASRYLSSVIRPPPPFRLPRPFYAPSLRATAAFVRRRIYQLI
ncbi:hypothetical protein DFH07DRAFT_959608 [Mycena maculata]|uniref:Uncharacterized protein n=1 Tax=Mycena maculata TaxID=230809 RepID=A0AAD7NCJ3_9AGAR|nr:hypothetical protein DFH07DRAFT_959608 [Mycena maculata]